MEDRADKARRWCFGCGQDNPQGLHIQFRIDGRRVEGQFRPRREHQGYPGLAHGGVAAAALDEAMGWALYAAGVWALTAKMEVRFRRPLPLGERVTVRAELTRDRRRWLEVESEIRAPSGEVLAQAKGVFMRVSRERAGELAELYGAEPGIAPSG